MAKLLICDDEQGLRAVIKRYAQFEDHQVFEAENGREALKLCQQEAFDIIIMDVMMPEMDGFSALREIRSFSDTPVIMLTARGEEYDKVLGFGLGVDDYVVKPFSSKEIMLRIGAILKRTGIKDKGETFEKEGLKVDLAAYKVMVDGQMGTLAPKEYELLFFLIRNKDVAVTRELILSEVWGYGYSGDDRTLDTHMKLLRKSLGPYARFITTLRGVGYRFEG